MYPGLGWRVVGTVKAWSRLVEERKDRYGGKGRREGKEGGNEQQKQRQTAGMMEKAAEQAKTTND